MESSRVKAYSGAILVPKSGWRIATCSAVAVELVVSDLRDIHRPAHGRRSSGFCDGKAASTKKSLTASFTVRGNRSA
jgi:hypothetical protein